MPSKTTKSTTEALKELEPLSKALSKSAAQIWKMFVMRYVAKGIGEIFLAIATVLITHSYYAHDRLGMLISYTIGSILVYDAIQVLVNPHYFAMNDVALRLKAEQLTWKKS